MHPANQSSIIPLIAHLQIIHLRLNFHNMFFYKFYALNLFLWFWNLLLLFLFHLKGRKEQRRSGKEPSPAVSRIPKYHNRWGLARLKPGARNSIHVSHASGWKPRTWTIVCLLGWALAGSWRERAGTGAQALSYTELQCLKKHLHYYARCLTLTFVYRRPWIYQLLVLIPWYTY